MRISIRRCLSILRNTSDGNELALPLPMPWKEHSVGSRNTEDTRKDRLGTIDRGPVREPSPKLRYWSGTVPPSILLITLLLLLVVYLG